jgi:hypothetical protein
VQGFFQPYLSSPPDMVNKWAISSWHDFQKLRSDPTIGVSDVRGYEFSEDDEYPIPKWMEVTYHRLARNYELPKGTNLRPLVLII